MQTTAAEPDGIYHEERSLAPVGPWVEGWVAGVPVVGALQTAAGRAPGGPGAAPGACSVMSGSEGVDVGGGLRWGIR